ncbi:Alpha/Beta hydrolase protein [Crepidotus variabilis]|uniref:Alpha/Beta hydrolase protein n=1 Tax=Crepidotus variabilis TaxID=179855 RepID=A0A9P6JUN6_9AGAR|nr:Alpha/Beta hydrolase protein [Crepidotus variabilis]
MLYDKNPPYPHYDNLPYGKEPWKALYVFQRLFTTLLLVPVWVVYYSIVPRRYRPRASWNLRQIVNINFTRRIFKVTEVAGVTWGTRDPTKAPEERTLRETRFEWVEPLKEEWRTGILNTQTIPFNRVGCFVWPKVVHPEVHKVRTRWGSNPHEGQLEQTIDLEDHSGEVPIIGIFMHGGGYCHMSANESSRTSRIPRGLVERKIMQEVYSVEYRLLQHAPFPAVVIDAAAVYAHVIEQYGIRRSKCKIVLIGDSSGGNLVLSLARWLRDEAHLPAPDGLLLLSPSSDPSQNLPETLSSYIPRPNERSDYLVDNPEPRALLQRTFLGFASQQGTTAQDEEKRLVEVIHSEYVSPCSPIVLKRWGHEAKQDPEGQHEQHFVRNVFKRLPTALRITRAPSALERSVILPQSEGEGAKVDAGPTVVLPHNAEKQLNPAVQTNEALLSPPPIHPMSVTSSTSSADDTLVSTSPIAPVKSIQSNGKPVSDATASHNYRATCGFPTLFAEFPRSLVVCGDAERLVREVRSLISAMEKDGVDLNVVWASDACHDVLILDPFWWDKKVIEDVWNGVDKWAAGFKDSDIPVPDTST